MDSIYVLEDIIVPCAVCVVLPVLVVWLVFRSRNHMIDRKTEMVVKAIECGQAIDPDVFFSSGKSRKTIKMALLGKLQSGIILLLAGAGLMIAAPFVEFNYTLYIGGIMLALGVGFIVSFFVGKRWMAPEIEAEQKRMLEQESVQKQKNPSEE